MNNLIQFIEKIFSKKHGFVLPFTMFIAAIMLLLSLGISVTLTKQIYFSSLSRESQAAYYAADNALACTLAIEETYTDANGIGILPYDPASTDTTINMQNMQTTLNYVNAHRALLGESPLASTLDAIICSRSKMIDITSPTNFSVNPTKFTRNLPAGGTEDGLASTFSMRMDLGDGTLRCATVTVNKTMTYRQIVAQGYSLCDRSTGSVERAVINTTIVQ